MTLTPNFVPFRIFLAIYLPLAGFFALGYSLWLSSEAGEAMITLQAREMSKVQVASGLIARNLTNVASDLMFLANAPSVRRYAETGSAYERRRIEELFANVAREKKIYDQIRFLDTQGMEVVRVNWSGQAARVVPAEELQFKGDRYFFRDSVVLGPRQVYVSPLDLNVEQNQVETPYKPMLRLATPVVNESGEKRGVLILNYLAEQLLADFRSTLAGSPQPMLVNRDGHWLSHPEPDKAWGFMFGRSDSYARTQPEIWRAVISKDAGHIRSSDGLTTFATVYPLTVGQISSTGSPLPSGGDTLPIDESGYFWKAVSFTPIEDLPSAGLMASWQRVAVISAGWLLLAFAAYWVAGVVASRRKYRLSLQKSEQQLRAITSTVGQGIYVVDREGKLVFMNREAERVLGWSAAELVGHNGHEVFHHHHGDGSAYPEAECAIKQVIECGETYRSDTETFWRRDGSPVPVEVSASLMLDEGAPFASVVAFQDISERQRAERELLSSQARIRALLDATSESVLLLTSEGDILAINAFGAQRFKQMPGDMLGKNFFSLLPPDLAKARQAAVQHVALTGDPLQVNDVRDGIHFENRIYPVKDEFGAVESVAIYARDVTENYRTKAVEDIFRQLDAMLLKWRMNSETIAQMFCDGILPVFNLTAAWIGRAEKDGRLTTVAEARCDDIRIGTLLKGSSTRWKGDSSVWPQLESVIIHGVRQVVACSDDAAEPDNSAFGIPGSQAVLLLPLTLRGKNWGVLCFYARERSRFEGGATPVRLDAIASRLSISLESALQQEWLTLLDTALAGVGNAVHITDPSGRIVWANESLARLTGYSLDDIVGETPKLFNSGTQSAEFFDGFWRTIQSGSAWRGDIVNVRPDGSRYTAHQTVTPLFDSDGHINHYIAVIEDITERKRLEASLEHAAHFDPLTDLPNRALFFDRLGQALALAKRTGRAAALLFLDLDHFKQINDDLGHAAGDELLIGVAKRLREAVRESDTVARLAGDEFTIILQSAYEREGAVNVANKILTSFSKPFAIAGSEMAVGVSIGIALFPEHGVGVEAILSAADQAMYQAKQAGRSGYAVAGDCFPTLK